MRKIFVLIGIWLCTVTAYGQACVTEEFTDFETNNGIWIGNPTYGAIYNNATYANSGTKAFYLKDNQPGSNIYTQTLDYSEKAEVNISFAYYPHYTPDGQFNLEMSLDDGNTFTTVRHYEYGVDFTTIGEYYFDTVSIEAPFSATTVFRFNANVGPTVTYLFIDDVELITCVDCNGAGDANNNGICDDVDADFIQTIIINEINYRNVNNQQNIKFIELYNYGNFSINLSNWFVTGGVNYKLPAGTTLDAGAFLIIAQDDVVCQNFFSINGVLGDIEGNLSTSGDEIILRDASFGIVDEVDYESWKEWPNVRYNDDEINDLKSPVSLQKINPEMDGKHAGSWLAAPPTPNAVNTTVFAADRTVLPVLKNVSKSPDFPQTGEEVRIKADFDEHLLYKDILMVSLEYQVLTPGNYIAKSDTAYQDNWISIPMLDDGIDADSTANNGVYTAKIPSSIQNHRNFVRYRIHVQTINGYSRYYPDPNHPESNYAYYIYDAYPEFNGYDLTTLDSLQEITILTKSSTSSVYIGNGTDNTGQYQGKEYLGEGTLIYNGKIYDHVRFRPRGGDSRMLRKKPGIKFDMNAEKKIKVQDDYDEDYKVERGKLALSGTWTNDVAAHGLTESLIYKILELCEAPFYKNADYTQLRIVDEAVETGNTGDFWGVFLILEDYGSDHLEENNLPEGNIWGYKPTDLNYVGDFPDADSIGIVTSAYDYNYAFRDRIANTIYGQNGNNYYGKHSQRDYYNSETALWFSWWGDMDNAFGSPNDDVLSFIRSSSNVNTTNNNALIIPAANQIAYQNEFRSVYDLLLNDEQKAFLVDEEAKKIYNTNAAYDWTVLDKSRWNQSYDLENIDAHINWYKTWFQNRGNHIAADTLDGIQDINIPETPTIELAGSMSLDNLTFSNSAFADPQGSGTFLALEWRIGEWSNPGNPAYQNKPKSKYEIQTKWKSGEINTFSGSFSIPADAQLKAGRTYKIRVRYKDDTGRWSHWSEPIQITPAVPVNFAPANLVINEIMYKPSEWCSNEFIEIYNAGNSEVLLDNYKFTDGIDFDFPKGSSIAPNSFLVLARDSLEFIQKYGFAPFGDYSGTLDSDGEHIVLEGPYRTIVDSLTFTGKDPWDEAPDGNGFSLELLNPLTDNANPLNWFRSDNTCGTPGEENSRVCTGTTEQIVINEINYNSDNGNFDPGDWVELHNPTANAIDLSDWTFYDNNNSFVFPSETSIAAGEFLVLAENGAVFSSLFPHLDTTQYLGDFAFGLSNKGERISLFNENKCLSDYVVYNDKLPWDTIPDGNGPTLSLVTPGSDNALALSWESSSSINSVYGTPGRENVPCPENEIIFPNEVCAGFPVTITVDNLYSRMNYNWFVFGATPSNATTDSITVVWNTPGTYNLQLVTSYFECTKIYNQQVTVIGCNDAPIAVDDNFIAIEDIPLNELISPNDSDPDNNSLIWTTSSIVNPENGALSIYSDGTFTYIPNPGFVGSDSFVYEVCDDATYPATARLDYIGQVTSGTDDVEELALDGSINTTSGDLDLMDDDGNVFNAAGIRIINVNIPQNAMITNAYLEFVADESNAEATSLTISAEAIGNAAAIPTSPFAISTKTKTTTVNWANIPSWTAGNTYSSTNISPVIQELVNQGDWQSGNAMTFIIEGTGTRTPESYEGGASVAPKLIVTYDIPSSPLNVQLCDEATVNITVEQGCIDLEIYALLEGPYDAPFGEMGTELNELRGLLPGQTPQSNLANPTPAGQPYNTFPWNYTGTEGAAWNDTDYTDDVVDWVLVSTRTDIAKSSEVGRAAGLLYKDGSIGLSENCALENLGLDSVYVVIEHRNHIGIMTPQKVPIVNHRLTHDFRLSNSYKDATSFGQKQASTGDWLMFAGDGDQSDFPSYDIKGTDKALWLDDNGVFQQYLIPDFDLNGDVNGADKALWDLNNGVSSRVPK